jgi:hypothetical protein
MSRRPTTTIPHGDYEVRHDLFDHPYVKAAQQHLDDLAARPDTPFTRGYVFPASLVEEQSAVAKYVYGTANEPVVIFDPEAHEAFAPDEVRRTVEHEVAHAMQESTGSPADEDEAEGRRFDPIQG